MALTWTPEDGTLAAADDAARSARYASPRPWIISGFALSAGTGLNVAVSAGTAWVAGYYVEWDAASEQSVAASNTNYVYVELTRDMVGNVTGVSFVVNTTGTPPSGDHIVLGTATTDGSGVTGTATTGRSPQNQGVTSVFGRDGAVVAAASDYDADQVDYDNSVSGLTATDVQAAIDELASAGGSTNVQVFTSSGTWTKPENGQRVLVMAFGAGGGGGSGRADAGSNAAGGAGGSGGVYKEAWFDIADLGATESVTIGVGGTGGAAKSPTNNGDNGTDGGDTSFGSHLTAKGGQGGNGGTSASTEIARTAVYLTGVDQAAINAAGGGSSAVQPMADSFKAYAGWKIAGGGGASTGGNAGTSTAGSGGAGFQIRTAAATVLYEGGAAGGVDGGSGANATTFGDGGGGGSKAPTTGTSAGNGGNGAVGGGGGGGGGGKRGATGTSGAGGNGGNGYMIVITI